MRQRAALRDRIERLEQRRKVRPFPRITLGIHGRTEAEAIGCEAFLGHAAIHFVRLPDEPLPALIERAYATTGALSVRLAYTARHSAAERVSEPSAYPSGPETSDGTPEAVPGVGKAASRAELIRMAAIPIPPERWVD